MTKIFDKKRDRKNIIIGITLYLLVLATTVFIVCDSSKVREPSSIVVVKPEEKEFTFIYKYQNKIFQAAEKSTSKEDAFKKSAKKCFQFYTQGKYPGEEKGLDIIDSCANPKSGL